MLQLLASCEGCATGFSTIIVIVFVYGLFALTLFDDRFNR